MTFIELALAAGAANEEEAEFLLWSGTAFPFVGPRTLWYQLRHVVRHKICADDPMASCCSRKAYRGPREPALPAPHPRGRTHE
jgi:hypothetical protein